MSVQVESPAGAMGAQAHTLSSGRPSLVGARVVVLDNGKPHAKLLMMTAGDLLAERVGSLPPVSIRKRSAAEPAEPEVMARVMAEADLVLTGSAD